MWINLSGKPATHEKPRAPGVEREKAVERSSSAVAPRRTA